MCVFFATLSWKEREQRVLQGRHPAQRTFNICGAGGHADGSITTISNKIEDHAGNTKADTPTLKWREIPIFVLRHLLLSDQKWKCNNPSGRGGADSRWSQKTADDRQVLELLSASLSNAAASFNLLILVTKAVWQGKVPVPGTLLQVVDRIPHVLQVLRDVAVPIALRVQPGNEASRALELVQLALKDRELWSELLNRERSFPTEL